MRYRDDLPLVLKKLCFEIAPEETVGIVGRTGSGTYPRAPSPRPRHGTSAPLSPLSPLLFQALAWGGVINMWPVKPFETVPVIEGYTNTI